jgi:putative acetyltransferase
MFSRVKILSGTSVRESLSLAPVAVRPGHQRLGIGSALVEAGIEACRKLPYTSMVVLGHPDFYPRFGFSSEIARSLRSPFGTGDAWMALELVPESLMGLSGVVEYPAPFDVFI